MEGLNTQYPEEKDGAEFTGNFVEGKRDGKGKLDYANKDNFDGTWANGMKKNGTYTWNNGDVFEGEFKNDKMSYGELRWKSGGSYKGTFVDDKREGNGIMTFKDGGNYTGQWMNN